MSKTHSIHAKTDGVVAFRRMTGFKRGQFYIDVVESK
jgi:ribosomal protein L27